MKSILRIPALLLLVAMLFAACSSSEDELPKNEYFVSFDVDGTSIKYEDSGFFPLIFSRDDNAGFYSATLVVPQEIGDGTSNFVHIIVHDEAVFQEGITYQMQDGISYQGGAMLARINFTWANEAGEIYNAVLLSSNYPMLDVGDDAAFTFTRISSDEVEGTFSATIFGPVLATAPGRNIQKKITNGKFKLKLTNGI